MSAPPMPPGKMPPRPPGMKAMPPMPPGFKAPSAAGGAPPMPPGRVPPRPPGAPPMPPGMVKQPASPAPVAPPPPSGAPRYPVPPYQRMAGADGGHPVPPTSSSSTGGVAPPPPALSSAAPSAPRYLVPPSAAGGEGGVPAMPTLSPNVMSAAAVPPGPPHGGDYGHAPGRYGDDYHPHPGRRDQFNNNRRYGRYDRYPQSGPAGYRDRYNDRYADRQDRGGRRPNVRRPHESQENPPMREPTNTVWVGSYDPAFHSRDMLLRAFWPFGRVMQVSVHEGKSYAFVHMRRLEEAKAAVGALMENRQLGPAIFNFSKHHDYAEAEMNLPHNPDVVEDPPDEEGAAPPTFHQQESYPPSQQQPGMRRPRDGDDGHSNDGRERREEAPDAPSLPPARRTRGERDAKEPSSVLWLGNLVPFITTEKLTELFEVFGPITNVSRLSRSNMAFLSFETVEQCTMALETMRGRAIDGVLLSMNYGHAAQPAGDGADGSGEFGAPGAGNSTGGNQRNVPLTQDGIPLHEAPTNLVYLGNLPLDATMVDVESLFTPYDGFIFSKYVSMNNIGFGHFDTVENARAARVGLMNATINGTPIRVSFGKQSHTYTMADRRRVNEPAPGRNGEDFNLDAMMRGPGGGALDGSGGALVAGTFGGMGGGNAGAMMLPAMGGGANPNGADAANANVYARVRPAPEMTLDTRLQSLLGSPYNTCGAAALEISPTQIHAVCHLVDNCVGESSGETMRQALNLYCPVRAVHVFNVVAKRMKEFADDPHKRLLVLYAVTHVLLSANTDYNRYTEAALNAYLMVLLVASEGQTSSGMDRLTSIIESLQQHPFIEKKCNAGQGYEEEFRAQLEDIANRAKAEQDLRSFATRRRRRN